MDTKTLTRQELRNHLEARDLSTTGNKGKLAERLQASILEERVSTGVQIGGGAGGNMEVLASVLDASGMGSFRSDNVRQIGL